MRSKSKNRGWPRLVVALSLLLAGAASAQQPQPSDDGAPRAARQPQDVSVHGERRIDDYFWLRERDKPEVQAHLRAEAAYTARWFQPLAGLKEQLFREMVGRIQQADEAVPVREGAWWYSTRTLEGAQYPLHVRRAARGAERAYDATAPEQLLLDLNRLAQGRKFLALEDLQVSPDAKLLAYSIDETGARDFQLQLRDIAGGKALAWSAAKVQGFAWSADSRHLFYITANEAKRADKLWRHRLDGRGPDELLYEEKDEQFDLGLDRSADRRYLVLSSRSKDTVEQRVLPATTPLAAWRVVLPRRSGLEYRFEHHAGRFLLLANDRGPNFRLLDLPATRLPLALAALARGRELVAHDEAAMLEDLQVFKRHLVLQVREGGSVKLRVLGAGGRGGPARELPFDEAVYTAQLQTWGQPALNREYDSDTLRLAYQSMTTPASVYDYALGSGALTLRKVQPVLGGFDAKRYESKRLWATAKDGTRVPISLVYAKDLRRQGPQPLLLQGYGSYGMSSDPRFSAANLSLLDRGAILAIAHVRGGGDLGRRWYLDGKLGKKMNSFTDFVACAEALVAEGYTDPGRLIITGGSAGGLLMGAVVNLRPELFKAVVMHVPFVDVINTMLDESLPLTTGEFIEWGNPKVAEQYAWMRAYSPYDNLKPGAYPAILARTGLNDSQVPYWEPAKYVAKLRGLKTDANPLLFDINMDVGHGGASGRFDALKERAQYYAFMLQQWGLADALVAARKP
ncbi:S9 family peptidase [Roseateles sp. DAIF2]|uniref:S9 family peptidase n=1 Tax=Roseateles sp. DAIF2 TaxID=2714952 RepID=UPI0018A27056|nr:S9 family peptidase [Roseateles sp. DAIF2]QPF74502.1 S9 family peptidase [Roseateles sp. DAIF2]